MYLRRVDEQSAVVIVVISIDVVIFGIEFAGALQKFHLGSVAQVAEEFDCLLCSTFMTYNRNLGVDNLLHPARDTLHILLGDGTPELQVAVITI